MQRICPPFLSPASPLPPRRAANPASFPRLFVGARVLRPAGRNPMADPQYIPPPSGAYSMEPPTNGALALSPGPPVYAQSSPSRSQRASAGGAGDAFAPVRSPPKTSNGGGNEGLPPSGGAKNSCAKGVPPPSLAGNAAEDDNPGPRSGCAPHLAIWFIERAPRSFRAPDYVSAQPAPWKSQTARRSLRRFVPD